MSDNIDLLYETKKKMLAKYPRFGSEVAASPVVFTKDVKTASTDGKKIYLNPEYFSEVNEDVRLYLLAHETSHKKFKHMYRLKDKNGNMRDLELWNIVCDALINANLKRDGIKIPDGRICSDTDEEYGEWVLQYNCEELYEMKKREKEEQEQEDKKGQDNKQGNEQSKQQNNRESQEQNANQQYNDNSEQTENQNSNEGKNQDDDHSLWEEAFKQQQRQNSEEKTQKQRNESNHQEQQTQEQEQIEEQVSMDFDEKEEFEENRKEKIEKFKSKREKTQNNIRNNNEEVIQFDNIGESKEEIDWRVLTRREIEKSETIWSQRRSIAENNYAYRLEENDVEDDAETEVMIDVSGSVNLELVKSFLRQLKPLLKESKLRVGCFNEKFWGFVDIKSARDIDNFNIPREARGDAAWTEDWDLAVRSFNKRREINKFVFTDGYPCPGTMPKEDLKKENIIWLVYGNKDFKPCCGKVIHITQKQLERLNEIDRASESITR